MSEPVASEALGSAVDVEEIEKAVTHLTSMLENVIITGKSRQSTPTSASTAGVDPVDGGRQRSSDASRLGAVEHPHSDILPALGAIKAFVIGDMDRHLQPLPDDQLDLVSNQLQAAGFFIGALRHLATLPIEGRKDVTNIFTAFVRKNSGDIVTHILNNAAVLESLLDGFRNPDTVLLTGQMLRESIKYPHIAYRVFLSPHFWHFFDDYVHSTTFDVASESFNVLKELLTSPSLAEVQDGFFEVNSDIFLQQYERLLNSDNVLTRRRSLKMLAGLLLERRHYRLMMKYIASKDHLKTIMNLLRNKSTQITFETFHVFKIFVANPKKSPDIAAVLYNNRNKLIPFLETFHADKNDPQFIEEKQLLIDTLRSMADPDPAGQRTSRSRQTSHDFHAPSPSAAPHISVSASASSHDLLGDTSLGFITPREYHQTPLSSHAEQDTRAMVNRSVFNSPAIGYRDLSTKSSYSVPPLGNAIMHTIHGQVGQSHSWSNIQIGSTNNNSSSNNLSAGVAAPVENSVPIQPSSGSGKSHSAMFRRRSRTSTMGSSQNSERGSGSDFSNSAAVAAATVLAAMEAEAAQQQAQQNDATVTTSRPPSYPHHSHQTNAMSNSTSDSSSFAVASPSAAASSTETRRPSHRSSGNDSGGAATDTTGQAENGTSGVFASPLSSSSSAGTAGSSAEENHLASSSTGTGIGISVSSSSSCGSIYDRMSGGQGMLMNFPRPAPVLITSPQHRTQSRSQHPQQFQQQPHPLVPELNLSPDFGGAAPGSVQGSAVDSLLMSSNESTPTQYSHRLSSSPRVHPSNTSTRSSRVPSQQSSPHGSQHAHHTAVPPIHILTQGSPQQFHPPSPPYYQGSPYYHQNSHQAQHPQPVFLERSASHSSSSHSSASSILSSLYNTPMHHHQPHGTNPSYSHHSYPSQHPQSLNNGSSNHSPASYHSQLSSNQASTNNSNVSSAQHSTASTPASYNNNHGGIPQQIQSHHHHHHHQQRSSTSTNSEAPDWTLSSTETSPMKPPSVSHNFYPGSYSSGQTASGTVSSQSGGGAESSSDTLSSTGTPALHSHRQQYPHMAHLIHASSQPYPTIGTTGSSVGGSSVGIDSTGGSGSGSQDVGSNGGGHRSVHQRALGIAMGSGDNSHGNSEIHTPVSSTSPVVPMIANNGSSDDK